MTTFIDEHLTHLRAAGRSIETITAREWLLRRVDAELPHGLVRALSRELAAWLGGQLSWSRWTLCTYHMHLRGFFAWACSGADPVLGRNPMSEIPRPRPPAMVPNPVTDAELDQALTRSDGWWRLVILLAAYAGLRACEIARQRREDVTEDWLLVRQGKGDQDATVPMQEPLWAAVRDLPPGPVVVRPLSGLPATSAWLSAWARRHFDRIGLPGVHLHRFRHWYGTETQRLCGDIRITQENMRHRNPTTTAGYAKVTDERRRIALRPPATLRLPG